MKQFTFKYPFLVSVRIMIFFLLMSRMISGEPTESKDEGKKICLTMIVRNESKIIERCLMSVKDIVDCMCICDTGSTDNTVALIEDFCLSHHIPGKVLHQKWENFGHNRSLSAISAQDMLKEIGFPLENTYLLMLDADLILEETAEFKKDQLTKDSYFLVQKSPTRSFSNKRLLKASLSWKSIGVTHEYWSSKESSSADRLKTLWIMDIDDGGFKSDKYERDVRLLTKGLQDEPENTRYMFYMGQSYACLGQYEEALKWYKNRISYPNGKEEVWFSKYTIGDIYAVTDQWDDALKYYLDAYQYNPVRAEPLERIATHYRLQGKYDLAYLFAAQGAKISYPKDQYLFISDAVYDYRFDEELSIAAYHTPFREEGFIALERLLRNRNIPEDLKRASERNLSYYAKNLKDVRFQPFPINSENESNYRPLNSSLIRTDGGFAAICKTGIATKPSYFLIQYDKNFNVLSQKEIVNQLNVGDFDDCRIFNVAGSLLGSCVFYDRNAPQIELFQLSEGDTEVIAQEYVPVKEGKARGSKKYWLPFMAEGEWNFISSIDPIEVCKLNAEGGDCTQIVHDDLRIDLSKCRSSAGPIPFDEGYLVLVHQMVFDNEKHYYHRFLYLDKNFNITHLTKPFIFKKGGLECCGGMVIDHSGVKLIMTVGEEGRSVELASIDLSTVRSLLENVR